MRTGGGNRPSLIHRQSVDRLGLPMLLRNSRSRRYISAMYGNHVSPVHTGCHGVFGDIFARGKREVFGPKNREKLPGSSARFPLHAAHNIAVDVVILEHRACGSCDYIVERGPVLAVDVLR